MANQNNAFIDTLKINGGANYVLDPIAYRGNVQQIPIDFDTDTGGFTEDDTLTFSETLPQKSRVVAIMIEHGAMGTSATLDIGYTGDADAIVAAYDISAASTAGVIVYAGAGVDIGAKKIVGVAGGAAWAADKTLTGSIFIVTDE